MNKNKMEGLLKIILASLTACAAWLFGVFDLPFQTLVFFLALDLVFGTVNAWNKNEITSKRAWQGFAKKIGTILIIGIAYRSDILLGLNGVIKSAALYGFIGSELYSIVENISALGFNLPKGLTKHFKTIIDKGEDEDF